MLLPSSALFLTGITCWLLSHFLLSHRLFDSSPSLFIPHFLVSACSAAAVLLSVCTLEDHYFTICVFCPVSSTADGDFSRIVRFAVCGRVSEMTHVIHVKIVFWCCTAAWLQVLKQRTHWCTRADQTGQSTDKTARKRQSEQLVKTKQCVQRK